MVPELCMLADTAARAHMPCCAPVFDASMETRGTVTIVGGKMSELTHIDARGNARMVEVSDKPITRREAVAEGFIKMGPEALQKVVERTAGKGDVLAVAQLAGIGGAKQTGTLIPLCHPVPLSAVSVELETREGGVYCCARVKAEWRTGVEMEALTAVSTALLTVYDMLKAVDRGMTMGPVQLIEKRGGRSGEWIRGE